MKRIDLPPVWLAAFAVLAWTQAQHLSVDLSLAHPVTFFAAGLLIGGGIILAGLAVMEFRKHQTTIIPHETPSNLIQSGIFKRSRNPIYLADVLILAGLCLWWDAVLALALVPILVWVLERRFIVPEENRMRREFRADYARYEQKVRRWL
ncbi:S-isoprenylcysteine methyltransferase [Roseobacter cerasinus]|uniref:S-isoprenylcysteine methyltransferase n=1 Tax=Roseobacter cerasinus TaxID=2602289 RepID=A0A640VTA3_9RHOB|nr:isoprenylcysteine carboxylmethyltransferase family protein [Roseobacter cerasinus]GFE51269.1 S-isoprenylcysteine methyltransferase [Roseobacter cerasinus]